MTGQNQVLPIAIIIGAVLLVVAIVASTDSATQKSPEEMQRKMFVALCGFSPPESPAETELLRPGAEACLTKYQRIAREAEAAIKQAAASTELQRNVAMRDDLVRVRKIRVAALGAAERVSELTAKYFSPSQQN